MQTHAETVQPLVHHVPPPEVVQRVILPGVSWETYERLLADLQDSHAAHFAYDEGRLEIMVLSAKHERPNRVLALLVEVFAAEIGIDIENLGSTTFKRADLRRGFEPDSCFYIQNAERIKGKDEIDLAVDPPPDLVIEIDITSPSLNKFPIFAAIGIPEVWRCDGKEVVIFKLENGEYRAQEASVVLPGLSSQVITQLLADSQSMKRSAWLRRVREWAQKRAEEND
jgi:Uma2 family endonuclease